MPKIFMPFGDKEKAAGSSQQKTQAKVRPALEVPPELRGTVEVPNAAAVAPTSVANAKEKAIPKRYEKLVAGKRVALDAKVFDASADKVFSAVVDALTALNAPVQSVDSASGTITTDWIRTDANVVNNSSLLKGMFGSSGARAYRYRFVTRTLRVKDGDAAGSTRLEIRTVGQSYINNHWVNRKFKRKYSDDVFKRVEERLTTN